MSTCSVSSESGIGHTSKSAPGKSSPGNLQDAHSASRQAPSRPRTPAKEEAQVDPTHSQYRDHFLVGWDDDEQANPRNWCFIKKISVTAQLGMLALAAAIGSSIISPANEVIANEFDISQELAVLSVSLYILGFALGPLIWAPMSEIWGRKISMLPAMLGLALFSIGVARSESAHTLFICRFLSGVFGSAPVSNVSAALGDIWTPQERGLALTFYATTVVGGPTIGPVIGSAITVNDAMGWRWTGYILAIWVLAVDVVLFITLPETYAPYLLRKRAQRLRKTTGDQRWHHPHEEVKVDVRSILTQHFARPVRMLFTEPIVACIAVYASFVYSVLYMCLEVFPIVFYDERQWPLVTSTLPFLALFCGVLSTVLITPLNQARYARLQEANGGAAVPEARLLPMAFGGLLFTIGIFWFAWTAKASVPWAACVVAAGFIGAGFIIIFQQCVNYLVSQGLLLPGPD